MAIYHCCIIYNAPYIAKHRARTWTEYITEIGDDALNGYADGLTDIRKVIAEVYDDENRWVAEWGAGYNKDDYQRLDNIFSSYSSRISRSGQMDALTYDTLHSCALMSLQMEKAIAAGDKESVDKATKLNKMIQDSLASEQLRTKDIKPTDELRLDGIINKLKQKYGLSVEMSQGDVMEMIEKWMTDKHYPITMDAAEHMLMSIINTTRRNDDKPEMSDLPEGAQFDAYESEFLKDPTSREIASVDYLGLPRRRRKRGNAEDMEEDE